MGKITPDVSNALSELSQHHCRFSLASRKCSWPSARQKKITKTTNFGISGNSPHPVFGVVHFGAFHFGREIVTVHSHHEGPLVKQRIKVHPPHGELVVCSKNLHFWLWGWREQHLGREKFQYFSGNNEAAPSEAAEFV